VDGELVGDVVAAAGGLDGVDIANHIGDGDIGGGEFFDVALLAMEPGDRRVGGGIGDQVAAAAADGAVGVIVNFAAFEVRRDFVEKRGKLPDEPGFGLSAKAQQNKIMTGKNGVNDLRHDRVIEAENAGKQNIPSLYFADQVISEFVFNGPVGNFGFRKGTVSKRA
jgi:hypothetical protein